MIVVDAAFAVKLVVAEPDSAKAHMLWGEWQAQREEVVAPTLFGAETASALRLLVHRGKLDVAMGDEAFTALRRLPVDIREPEGLYERAWSMAKELNRPVVYDCLYLALAESLGCELWTADERLARVAQPRFPWVRTLSEVQSTS